MTAITHLIWVFHQNNYDPSLKILSTYQKNKTGIFFPSVSLIGMAFHFAFGTSYTGLRELLEGRRI